MLVQIKFTCHGSDASVGGFSPGNVMRVDEKLAERLVKEAKVAELVKPEKAKPAVS